MDFVENQNSDAIRREGGKQHDVTAAVGEPKTNPEENAEMSSPTDAEAERDEEPQR
jgi:hypothetical protein